MLPGFSCVLNAYRFDWLQPAIDLGWGACPPLVSLGFVGVFFSPPFSTFHGDICLSIIDLSCSTIDFRLPFCRIVERRRRGRQTAAAKKRKPKKNDVDVEKKKWKRSNNTPAARLIVDSVTEFHRRQWPSKRGPLPGFKFTYRVSPSLVTIAANQEVGNAVNPTTKEQIKRESCFFCCR